MRKAPRHAAPLIFDEAVVGAAMRAWLPRLVPLVEAMAERIDARTIELTAAAFIVARSFPRRAAGDRPSDFLPIVALFERAVDGLSDENLVERVDALADAISAEPGLVRRRGDQPVRPISAASKLVWTARPSTGIIFDARARNCLLAAGLLRRSGGYGAYVEAVRGEDNYMLNFIIMYALSIVVRYLPSVWHEIEDGQLDSLRALLEQYIVVMNEVMPLNAIERITGLKLQIVLAGTGQAPV